MRELGQKLSPLAQLELSIANTMYMLTPEYYYRICHVTGGLGAYALGKLTGQQWGMGAGSLWVGVEEPGTDGPHPLMMEIDAAQTLKAMRADREGVFEYHCWNAWSSLPVGTLVTAANQHHVVLIDFTARFWPNLCQDHHLIWNRQLSLPVTGNPLSLSAQALHWRPVPGLAECIMDDDLTPTLEAITAWKQVAAATGLDEPGFGQQLALDISQRCEALRGQQEKGVA